MPEPSPLLTSEGALVAGGDAWVRYLSRFGYPPMAGKDSVEQAFIARNFLLDEGISEGRVASYGEAGAMADHGEWETWQGFHVAYLEERVYRPASGDGLPMLLDPADELACPETFRLMNGSSVFAASDRKRHLIRVEGLNFLARFGGEPVEKVREWAVAVTERHDRDAERAFDRLLETWSQQVQARPAFAAFLDDVAEVIGLTPEETPPAWADDLRDCLGLFHLDPGDRKPEGLEIAVFRYEIGEVPRLKGMERDHRPLAPPTVLDARPSPAFLPAPRRSLTGHVVDLSCVAKEPRREVVHPTLPYRAKHLWRLGKIVRPVDRANLALARGLHLVLVRGFSGRDDYARGTDGDLT